MKELNIVIPAKEPEGAKSRLSEVLSYEQRKELALSLFSHTVSVLLKIPSKPHILVVTDSETIQNISLGYGISVLREEKASGETEAALAAARWSLLDGFKKQLIIPADIPFISDLEIEKIISYPVPTPGIVLSPAVDDDGTNAILTSPPDVIPFRFGKKSFDGYKKTAIKYNIPLHVLRLQGLILDIDTPDDLKKFFNSPDMHETKTLLRKWKIL